MDGLPSLNGWFWHINPSFVFQVYFGVSNNLNVGLSVGKVVLFPKSFCVKFPQVKIICKLKRRC